MTEPAPRRRLSGVHVRYLAVAVLLAGMAYVTYDTQQQVHRANDQRATLQKKVTALEQTVNTLTAENRRLTTLLLKAGIDPRPTPSPSAVASPSASRARTVRVTPTTARRTTTPSPRPAPSATPRATPRASQTPEPRPSATPACATVYNPLTGKCVT